MVVTPCAVSSTRMSRQAPCATRQVLVSLVLMLILSPGHSQPAALEFDGVDDLVFIDEPGGFGFTSALTVEAWVKPAQVDRGDTIGIVDGSGFVLFQRFTDNSAWGLSIVLGGPTDAASSPTGSLVANCWTHLAATFDGTTMRLFQDGVFLAEADHLNAAPGREVYIDGPVHIGRWIRADAFEGVIDEVRIWDIVRGQNEIQQFMREPLTGTEAGLIGYWPFDEASGQVVMGYSSQQNHGSLGFTIQEETDDPMWTVDHDFVFIDGFEATL